MSDDTISRDRSTFRPSTSPSCRARDGATRPDGPELAPSTSPHRGAVREILIAIGEDPDRDGLLDTPDAGGADVRRGLRRAARAPRPRTSRCMFEADHDEMVMVRDIPLTSMCEHHLVPFMGKAHVAYIPNDDGRVTGLSKLARLVDAYAKRPQVQERLTTQIADEIERTLQPKGVLVVIEAEHLCMSMRGVRKPGSSTVTSAVRGLFRDNTATRFEAMRFIAAASEPPPPALVGRADLTAVVPCRLVIPW